ncbi:posterior protein-like [Xenopus laevis]|uniref:Posterior protein-like n=1 Tax=Xenopus laevis TaxID=8355 RepID=A0A8J1LSJ6_XENLA|nr:posterior protein-like [Xenopus laevis]
MKKRCPYCQICLFGEVTHGHPCLEPNQADLIIPSGVNDGIMLWDLKSPGVIITDVHRRAGLNEEQNSECVLFVVNMEFVERYVNKYASGDYHSCADESLTHQFKSLLTQCQSYNNKVKCNHLAKMVKKIKMANEILALLKMKVIAENKAEQWRNEKAQFREDLEKFGESLIVAASTSEEHISELEELREKVELLAKQNDLLEEKLKDCE